MSVRDLERHVVAALNDAETEWDRAAKGLRWRRAEGDPSRIRRDEVKTERLRRRVESLQRELVLLRTTLFAADERVCAQTRPSTRSA